jgi:hypothetical protein
VEALLGEYLFGGFKDFVTMLELFTISPVGSLGHKEPLTITMILSDIAVFDPMLPHRAGSSAIFRGCHKQYVSWELQKYHTLSKKECIFIS